MNIFKLTYLSLKNLFRNSRRTLITVLVSSSGFAALAIVSGYMDFTFYGLKELTICKGFTSGGGNGHIELFNKDYALKEEHYPLEYGISEYQTLQSCIETDKNVIATIPRIEFNGLISNGDKSISFLGTGIEPKKEIMLIKYWNNLSAVTNKDKIVNTPIEKLYNNSDNSVLLGEEMAKVLDAKPGSDLMLMSTTVDGAVNVVDVTVAGISKNPMKSIDRYYLVTNLKTAQNLLQTDKISKIVLVLNSTDKTNSEIPLIANIINRKYNQSLFTILPWHKNAEYYQSIRDAYNIIFSFTGIIVVVIVFLSCTNTMLMATMERVREIGVMKAIGISNSWITLMFLIEGFFIGLFSIVFGMVLKYIFSSIINNIGFNMPPPPGMSMTYILQIFSASQYLPWISILVIISTTFSGLISVRRIKNISIVSSLTHV
jgi:putative ABC transport system permease protein